MPYSVKPCDPMAARELGRELRLAPALAQVLLHRGMDDAERAREFLLPQLAGLTSPDAMLDRAHAADRLASALRRREQIAVFGDYDVDGTTSAAILGGILEQLGGRVHVAVGNRWDGGYGLSDTALDKLLACSPRVLVTCDCGSSDHERIARATKLGIDVIVVDHHLVPEDPLPAFAFLNPHRPECGFGYKGLASAGLVLSLGAAVRAALGVQHDLRQWLDLVALGTIADVAPLDGDNRRLVRAGLARLTSDQARPGVIALRELARLQQHSSVSALDVGFKMTPRLNAAGRMGDPALTLALLRASDISEARQLAARIEQCNDERKATEKRVTELAFAQVLEHYGPEPSCGVVLAAPEFHRGVVGITAARVAERFGVAAVVIGIEDGPAGGHGHGSARARDGFPLYDALVRCEPLLERFGGHNAAAGVTIATGRVPAFREMFAAVTRELGMRSGGGLDLPIADVRLEPGVFELPEAQDLSRLEPIGMANAEPVFLVPDAKVIECGVVNGAHLKLVLRVGGPRPIRAFGYDMGESVVAPGAQLSLLGHLRIDAWNGNDRVELRLLAPPRIA